MLRSVHGQPAFHSDLATLMCASIVPHRCPRANTEDIDTGLLNYSQADQEELAKVGVI
jgi:hypothetical protein